MAKILGLDIGTNSIGWSLIEKSDDSNKIVAMGARIIPMGAELSKFEQGQAQTKNANRRIARGTRKLNKRYKQRRNKLIYLLIQVGMLPEQIKLVEPFANPNHLDRISILPIEKKQRQLSALDLIRLRVRALHGPVSLQELGKIIYLFNQLRGYAGGSSEPEEEKIDEDEDAEKKGKESFVTLCKVLAVSQPEMIHFKGKELKKFRIKVEYEEQILEGDTFLDILIPGESLELFISITTSKKKEESIFFKLPNKTSWRKKMENLDKELNNLSREQGREIFLSEYFLGILEDNKWEKIRNNVILRSRYQSEFDAIWQEQCKHHTILSNFPEEKLAGILYFIFPGAKDSQANYRETGLNKGLFHVLRNQIIYYQRELKDQSDLISNCRFEHGEKVVAKSHPVFQEYRVWEQINKLSINTKTEHGQDRKGNIKYSYIDKPLPWTLKEWLYDELQTRTEISFSVILNKLKKDYQMRDGVDFLNGINPKAKLRGNETKVTLIKLLGELVWNQLGLESPHRLIKLWEILYNSKGSEYDLESERTSLVLKFLEKYAESNEFEHLAIQISKIKFARSYGALSLKAIEKILPLVRAGRYFNHEFTNILHEKIIRLSNEILSDPFEKSAQQYLDDNHAEVLSNGGMMNVFATILIYDKHTSREFTEHDRLRHHEEIKRLVPGELRNPLVEQLISETLVIVKDIWKQFGRPDEVRLELARELKNNAERRAKVYKSNNANQKANDEVKKLLIELKQEVTLGNIEKYKLWLSQEDLREEYVKTYKDPSRSEVEKMKLWREQSHISPYTGQPIPISELFNRELYDIDHIIPQSRYFDDSFANKVICEKSVNRDKNNRTAMEYFDVGSIIPSVFSKTHFIDHVNRQFHGTKRKNLLATKVPEDPIARQMKETQYISVRVKEELGKIVGSANVKTTTGGVTDYLRNQWGLTDKFKAILQPRYEQNKEGLAEAEYEKNKEKIADKDAFIEAFCRNLITRKNNKLIIKGWSKRIDHRHHAMDALVIACTEPAHVKRLNDLNKELQTWLDQNKKELLPEFEGTPTELLDEILSLEENKRRIIFEQIKKFKSIEMPWIGFPEDASREIMQVIISQKPKDKLLIQPEQRSGQSADKGGTMQVKIRAQLHEGTLYGKSQGKEAYRIPLNKLAGKNFATEKAIDKITNPYLKMILKKHLHDIGNKENAFSAEGVLVLNKILAEKKNNIGEPAPHTPISSIRIFYKDSLKTKNKKNEEESEDALQRLNRVKSFNDSLFVKTGDNYLFAVMEKQGKRIFDLISLFDAANYLKDEVNKSNNKDALKKDVIFREYFEVKNQAKLLFTLKQGDPVYMPLDGEDVIIDPSSALYKDFWNSRYLRSQQIHYVTKYSGNRIYFIKHMIADVLVKGKEFGSQNAYEKIGDQSIKDHAIKLSIDRLGNVLPY